MKQKLQEERGTHMVTTSTAPRWRVRPGVLDHIMRTRRLTTEEQLAAVLGVDPSVLPELRAGALITARMALHIATLQGDSDFIDGYCEPVAA